MSVPSDVEHLLSKAKEGLKTGAFGKCFESITKALSIAPSSPQARLLLANLFYHVECPDLAVQEVRLLKDRFPGRESLARLLVALDPSEASTSKASSEAQELAPEARVVSNKTSHETRTETPVQNATDDLEGGVGEGKDLSKQAYISVPAGKSEEVLAETDFDFDDLDLLDQ